MVSGWTSPYLAKFNGSDRDMNISEEQASWIASILSVGRVAGALIGAIATEWIGSKKTLLLTGIPQLLGWAVLIFDQSAVMLYISRILLGVGMGGYYSSFPLYLGEVSNPKIRGGLISFIMNGVPIGTLIGSIIGAKTPMWIFSLISTGLSVLYIALFAFLPESPHYLLRRDNMEKARESMEWYQRDEPVCQDQLDSIRDFVFVNKSLTISDRMKELFQPVNRKALVCVALIYVLMQMSGIYSIVFYMEIILTESKVNVIEPSNVVIIVSAVSILSGWITMLVVDKYGRRLLLSLSCGGASVSLFLLAIHHNLIESGHDVTNWQALPIVAILIYQWFVNMGIIPVPSAILSETFAPNIKSIAACIISTTSGIFAFFSSKTFQPMLTIMTMQYVLLFYGMFMTCTTLYCFLCIPETKGKTLQEIQIMLMKKSLKS